MMACRKSVLLNILWNCLLHYRVNLDHHQPLLMGCRSRVVLSRLVQSDVSDFASAMVAGS